MLHMRDDGDILEEEELEDDESVSLDDDLLSEVGDEEDPLVEDDMEGFGLLEDTTADEEEEPSEEDELLDGDESLEEDAEDVDYDSFDDVDEM